VTAFAYNILIVSDQRILRQGLRLLLERHSDFHIVDDVDGKSALKTTGETEPTIMLLDLKLPSVEDGLILLAQVRQLSARTHVIALTPREAHSTLVLQAVRAGAVGYVPEDSSDIDMVEEAIRKVGQGHLYLSDTSLRNLLGTIADQDRPASAASHRDLESLTRREYDVIELVAQGYTNRQISARLTISESTARSHLHNILDKLQLANRVQLATYALSHPIKVS
jgi:two-component system nitrate/nitrite response regulator NarL